jgi:hypothetical protein
LANASRRARHRRCRSALLNAMRTTLTPLRSKHKVLPQTSPARTFIATRESLP